MSFPEHALDVFRVSLDRYFKPPVNPRTHLITSFSLLPLRFSMALPLKERSEKARLIATAKIIQQRFDTYLANPCFPQLVAVMASLQQRGAAQDNKVIDEQAKARDKQPPASPWVCAFTNLGVIENRLQTHHDALVVQHMNLGVRHKRHMCGIFLCALLVWFLYAFLSFRTMHMWTIHSRLYFQIVVSVFFHCFIKAILMSRDARVLLRGERNASKRCWRKR